VAAEAVAAEAAAMPVAGEVAKQAAVAEAAEPESREVVVGAAAQFASKVAGEVADRFTAQPRRQVESVSKRFSPTSAERLLDRPNCERTRRDSRKPYIACRPTVGRA
jgi:hypothetical protein